MNQNKLFYKWILPIGTFVFCYLTLGTFLDSKLNTKNLRKIDGEVVELYYSKLKYTQLNLELKDGNVYKVTSEWGIRFAAIENEIRKVKNIEIYHRSPLQCLYRFGTSNVVYQLKIGDKLIIDIKERQSMSKNLMYLTGFISILGLSVMIIRRKKTTIK